MKNDKFEEKSENESLRKVEFWTQSHSTHQNQVILHIDGVNEHEKNQDWSLMSKEQCAMEKGRGHRRDFARNDEISQSLAKSRDHSTARTGHRQLR